MKTNYKDIESPYHNISSKAYDFSNKQHPVREEIEKNEGTFNFTAVIREDKQALALFKHVPGFIAFICTLKIGDKIIGEGRGTSVISRMNKFIERSVRYAFNASIIDATVRSVKTMDVLHLNKPVKKIEEDDIVTEEEIHEAKIEMESEESITDKQKQYLIELVNVNIAEENEKGQWLSNINDFTKSEASKAIQNFKS